MENLVDIINQSVEVLGNGTRHATSAIDLASKMKTLFSDTKRPGDSELSSLVMKLADEVQNTKLANLDLKDQLLQMRETAMETQRRDKEFDRYELWQSPAGGLVLRLREASTNGEPHHYLCPQCKEGGRKSILQGENRMQCNVCKSRYQIAKSPQPRAAVTRSGTRRV